MYRVIHAKPVYKEEDYEDNFPYCEWAFLFSETFNPCKLAGACMNGE